MALLAFYTIETLLILAHSNHGDKWISIFSRFRNVPAGDTYIRFVTASVQFKTLGQFFLI